MSSCATATYFNAESAKVKFGHPRKACLDRKPFNKKHRICLVLPQTAFHLSHKTKMGRNGIMQQVALEAGGPLPPRSHRQPAAKEMDTNSQRTHTHCRGHSPRVAATLPQPCQTTASDISPRDNSVPWGTAFRFLRRPASKVTHKTCHGSLHGVGRTH